MLEVKNLYYNINKKKVLKYLSDELRNFERMLH